MGAGAERVAFLIETQADLTGVKAVRAEASALSQDADKARTEALAGDQKLVLSQEQVRRAVAEAGSDFAKLQQVLARMVAEENALAEAARKAAAELERQQRIAAQTGTTPLGPLGVPGPQQLGPYGVPAGPQQGPIMAPFGPQLGPAVPGLTTAAARAASQATIEQIQKIPPAARTATNALGMLAQAAATGDGTARGLAIAAGNAAQGIAVMSTSAKVAASAAGIGALAVAIGVLIGLALEAKRALMDIPEGVLSKTAADHIANLKTQKQITLELGLVQSQIDRERANNQLTDETQLQRVMNLEAKKAALLARSRDLVVEGRKEAERAAKEEEQRAKERAAQVKTATDHLNDLRNAAAEAADKATQTEYEQKRRAIERQAADERRANDELIQSDSMRAQALDAINDKRRYALILLEKEAEIAKKRVIDEGLAGYAKLSTAVRNHGTVVGAVAKAAADAVRLHEIYVAGKKAAIMAKIEWAAAMAAFGSGNLAGGALHLAAAAGYGAAAVAAGAEAANTVSGGGGGGGGSDTGAAGSGTTFQGQGAAGGGGMTVVLQTVNPYGREVIGEAIYQIDRAGKLKRPIPIAPTTGLVGAPA
jgi:hypothetical protein